MKRWVTSDWHLGHHNIIRYCERPFASIAEMDKTIIDNHNALVKPEDIVYFLGDFCFYKNPQDYMAKVNGRFYFIVGNHDKQGYFSGHPYTMSILYARKTVQMRHDPNFHYRCDVNLCGHVHEKWREQGGLINVGVDVWDFKPVNLDFLV